MFGLVVFGGIAIYFLLSILIIILAVSWADRYKKPPGKVGFIAALIVFGPVLWDFIPVHVIYNYQCKVNAGFTVHKTLEQWKQENPGVAEKLVVIENRPSTQIGDTTRYQLNQRFAWEIYSEKLWHVVQKRHEKIIDIETGEILAEYIDFNTDIRTLVGGDWRDLKFWIAINTCEEAERNRTRPLKFQFNKFMYLVQHQKEFEQ